MHSPAGRALGPPSRLQVRSTAYGTITVWLTGSAAVLLVVLAAHRVVRRVRGEPSPRDRTGPSVGPPTRARDADTRDADTRDADTRTDTRDAAPGTGGGGTGAPDGPADGTGPRVGPGTPHDAGAHAARPGASDPSGTGPPPVTHADRPRRRGPSLGRASSLTMAVASLVSRVTGFLRQLAAGERLGPGRRQRLLHGREHAAQHRLRAAARRRADQRDRPAAGPRADRGRRRRRGLHPAAADRRRRRRWPARPCWRCWPRRC